MLFSMKRDLTEWRKIVLRNDNACIFNKACSQAENADFPKSTQAIACSVSYLLIGYKTKKAGRLGSSRQLAAACFILTDKNCDFPANSPVVSAIGYSRLELISWCICHTESFRIRSCLMCFFMANNMTCFLLNYYNIISVLLSNILLNNIRTKSKNEKNTYKYLYSSYKNLLSWALAKFLWTGIQLMPNPNLQLF